MARPSAASALGEAYKKAAPYLSLGIQFTASILLCLFAGRWLDQKWDTSPFLMLLGIVFGTVAGFYHFFRAVSRIPENEKPVEAEKTRGGADDRR